MVGDLEIDFTRVWRHQAYDNCSNRNVVFVKIKQTKLQDLENLAKQLRSYTILAKNCSGHPHINYLHNLKQASIAKAIKLAPIKRLLVANRGDIACRIIRTAHKMNIETIAVYSEADREALHVKMADEAYLIGEAEPRRSYLNQSRIMEIASKQQCSAVHPGYGFLSESFKFAQVCREAGLASVGPPAEAIRQMGLKNESKRIMEEAGVPVVPGYHGSEQTDERLLSEAERLGFPLMIKPVRGGGGKGMRVVLKPSDFRPALESARRESLRAFGDQAMLLERYIGRPRHVEVQVFGDHLGEHVHLFERDCSLQRRHQKIIEEALAPLLSEKTRADLGEKAVAVGYVGAGTVEFILDTADQQFSLVNHTVG